jgi:hypothetical protein
MSSSNCATLYEAKKLIGSAELVIWETNSDLKDSAASACRKNKKALRGLGPPQGLEIYN